MHWPTSNSIWVIIAVICMILSCTKNSEIGTEQETYFVKYFGGSASDSACDLSICADEGYALTGNMLTATGNSQAFFIRTDKYGNELVYSPILLGQGESSFGRRLCQTKNSSFLVVGSITHSSSKKDILLRKISADGAITWTKDFGTDENDEGFCVKELENGNIIVGGYTESSATNKKDAWVITLNSSGDIIWANTFGGTNDDICYDLQERDDYILLIGSTESFQYDKLKKSVFLVKINKSSGNNFDAAWYGSAENESGVRSVTDANGYIYILANRVNLASDTSNIYLLKLTDDIHQAVWEKTIASSRYETGNDIILNNDRMIITGSSTSAKDADFLIYVLDLDGNVQNTSSSTIPALGNQNGQACVIGSDGRIIIAGSNSVEKFSKIALIKTDLPK